MTRTKKKKSKSGKRDWLNLSTNSKWALAVICLLTLAAYWPSLQNGFTNWDDEVYVVKNSMMTSPPGVAIKRIFSEPVSANYHPMTMLSLWLNFQIGGLEAFGYHLVNILFHLANSVLAFLLIWRLSRAKLEVTVIAAFLFAIHPMHVESVTWIAERKDVLYVFFFLAGLLSYLQFRRDYKRAWLYITILLFVLSVLSKAMAVVFPLVLLLIDYWESERPKEKKVLDELKFFIQPALWKNKILFFMISIAFGILAVKVQSAGGAVGKLEVFTFGQRIMFAGYGFISYIGKLFVPVNLSCFYPYPSLNESGMLPLIYYLAPLISMLILAVSILSLKKTKVIFTGIFFYLFTVVLVLQFLSVGQVVMAERYTYLPYLGLGFIVGYGIYWLSIEFERKGISKWLILIPMGIFFVFLTYGTYERTKVWESSETLWTDAIQQHPNKIAVAHKNRGNYLAQNQRIQEALADFNIALQLDPEDAALQESLGNTYASSGQIQQAIPFFNKAIQMDPKKTSAYLNRAIAYSQLKNYDQAFRDYRKAIELGAEMTAVLPNRGYALMEAGRLQEALQDFSQAIRIMPANGMMHIYQGITYLNLGDKTNARAAFSRAQQLGQQVDPALLQQAQ